AVPLILKLAPLNLARLQGLPGHRPRQGLNVRFLVQTNHYFPPLIEPFDTLITPQHLGRQGRELRINRGRLPIPASGWSQTRPRHPTISTMRSPRSKANKLPARAATRCSCCPSLTISF